ncbi:MAG: flagellar hook-basal body complex protein [Duganella sp.]
MSFDIALSGIQAINQSLNSTSQNIANAGTYGYKALRSNFASMVSGETQTGAMIGSTTQFIGKQGGVLNTGRALDASINGRGFFMTRDTATNQVEYTRVGIFDASREGFLVDASGRRVQGYPVDPNTSTMGALGDITIATGTIPADVSEKLNYSGNFSADWTSPAVALDFSTITPETPPETNTFNMSKATTLYDTLGGKHVLTQYFVRNPTDTTVVDVHYVLDGKFVSSDALKFDPASGGSLVSTDPDPAVMVSTRAIDLSTQAFASQATLGTLTIDYAGSTGANGDATNLINNADGYAAGTFTGVALGVDGSIIASYTNGQKQTIGRLGIATFPDEGSLTTVSGTSWIESVASGTPLVSAPGNGMAGTINVSSLEQSNVDITSELVGLMTSQRNYQANSKVIQTESTMLQSLMQAI